MGLFVVLEGIDGCGKTTQCGLLAKQLDAELFSFPDYDTPSGKLILSHLKREWAAAVYNKAAGDSPDETYVDAMVFQSLHFTNRMELQTPLGLCLAEGRDVVSDRYIGSGLAYGCTDGLDWQYLRKVQRHLIQPDVNILIDVDLEDSIKRRPERRDRYEDNADFLSHVATAYREVWDRMGLVTNNLREDTLWAVVDGRGNAEETHDDIFDIVSRARKLKCTAKRAT